MKRRRSNASVIAAATAATPATTASFQSPFVSSDNSSHILHTQKTKRARASNFQRGGINAVESHLHTANVAPGLSEVSVRSSTSVSTSASRDILATDVSNVSLSSNPVPIPKPPPFRVLSLFDGISCARVAIEQVRQQQQQQQQQQQVKESDSTPANANAKAKAQAKANTKANADSERDEDSARCRPVEYMSSEICPFALAVTRVRWPESVEVGNVLNVHWDRDPATEATIATIATTTPTPTPSEANGEVQQNVPRNVPQHKDEAITNSSHCLHGPLDLLVGGSPCTDLSTIGKRAGLGGPESKLFWEYVRIRKESNPRYFLFENVAGMMQEAEDEISAALGCKPVLIDAGWFGPAVRRRKFWTNIPLDLEDLKRRQEAPSTACLGDVLLTPEDLKESAAQVTRLDPSRFYAVKNPKKHRVGTLRLAHVGPNPRTSIFSPEGKLQSMTQECCFFWVHVNGETRTLDPREVELAQGLPKQYTDVMIAGKKASRYKRGALVGLGFNINVVAWILSHIPLI